MALARYHGQPAIACDSSIVAEGLRFQGFVANSVESQGPDVGVFGAYSNTLNWCLVFLFGQLFAALKRRTGSWLALLLGPVVLRGGNLVWYLKYASIDSARSQLK